MRSVRWLLLVAMIVIAAVVFGIYRAHRLTQRRQRPVASTPVPLDSKSVAPDWEWGQSANGLPAAKIFAKHMSQSVDGSRVQLNDIEFRVYQKDGLHYDRVRSAYAQLTTAEHKFYSPGDAEITLSVPVQGAPPHPLTSITTAGLNFDSESYQAVTNRHVSFRFENGNGTSEGATYDPSTHTLNLTNNVVVNMNGRGPNSKPMRIESNQLAWNESTGVLFLSPASHLIRDQNKIDAGPSTVLIKDNLISVIDADQVHGADRQPARQVEYSADKVHVQYNDQNEIDRITGSGNARLVSNGQGSQTTVTGTQVDLMLTNVNGQDVLSAVNVNGKGYLESRPLPDPKGATPDTKILRSEILNLKMKPGGKDLEQVVTQAPGTLEFVPNQTARHRRILKADRMTVGYGAKNEVQAFYATAASTETWPSEDERKNRKQPLTTASTSSKVIEATFDEKGELKLMKQSQDFQYTNGERKAQAESATLQNDTNIMDLDANARISDMSGSTSGDHIQMQQSTGDFDARGHVATTRLPEPNKSASAMLDKDEPTLGTADRVTSSDHNRLVRYTGNAVLWQTSNRVQADRIDLDRDKKSLVADGKVVTWFEDKANADAPARPKPAQPTYTIVKAPHMSYTDGDRLATYTGGVDFWRPTLTVKSTSLKAFLNPQDSDADSRINHAFGDGSVEIVQFVQDRQRVGHSEHAEYYTDEGKIILTGGEPKLDDSKRGNTTGEKLTYYTGDNRLQIDGAPKQPARSHLRKKS